MNDEVREEGPRPEPAGDRLTGNAANGGSPAMPGRGTPTQ